MNLIFLCTNKEYIILCKGSYNMQVNMVNVLTVEWIVNVQNFTVAFCGLKLLKTSTHAKLWSAALTSSAEETGIKLSKGILSPFSDKNT